MGVPKYYYTKFARFLAGRGFTVITYDYRGIGGSRPKSLRSFQPRYQDWGALDARAVVRWATDSLKPHQMYSICHSGGAQILGLVPEIETHTGLVTIASPSGAWRHWPHPRRHQVRLLAAVLPLVALTVGYVPLRFLRIGRHSRCGRVGMVAVVKRSAFSSRRGIQARSLRIQELPRANLGGKHRRRLRTWLHAKQWKALSKMYAGARAESMHVVPADYSADAIGHFGFFKDYFKHTLGESARLDESTSAQQSAAPK